MVKSYKPIVGYSKSIFWLFILYKDPNMAVANCAVSKVSSPFQRGSLMVPLTKISPCKLPLVLVIIPAEKASTVLRFNCLISVLMLNVLSLVLYPPSIVKLFGPVIPPLTVIFLSLPISVCTATSPIGTFLNVNCFIPAVPTTCGKPVMGWLIRASTFTIPPAIVLS